MAIIKSALFDSLRGSVSDVTFRKRKNGRIELGQKHMPKDPRSTAQLDSRAGYTQLMEVYMEDPWVSASQYARLAALTDISGWNAFVQRHQAGMKRNPTAYWGIAEESAEVQIHDFQGIHDSTAQAYTPKQYGPAAVSILGFDQTNDNLTIADHADLNINLTDDLYFAFTIKAYTATTPSQVIWKLDSGPSYWRGYHVTIFQDGKVRLMIHDNTKPGGTWPLDIRTSSNIRDASWHIVEVIRDLSAGEAYIYIDDELEASGPDNTTQTSANSHDLFLGNNEAKTLNLNADMRDITLDIG